MHYPETQQGGRFVHPSGSRQDAQHDPLLRHPYSEQLSAAAERFLLAAFDGENHNPFGEQPPVNPTLVSAAMHILNGTAWTQPSDEQVRASIYLQNRERDLPAEPPRRSRPDDEPGQRAA